MILRITRIIAVILLVVLPFSPVLSNFSPYWVPGLTFKTYLAACLLFAIISLLLGYFIAESNRLFSAFGIFFFLGMLVAPPLSIGPPELSLKLLELRTEEHFRYGMLLVSSLVFGIGAFTLVAKKWDALSPFHKLIVLPVSACLLLLLWDNFSSYHFSSEMEKWIAMGKTPETFAMEFDFKEFWRLLGRTLLYIINPWLGFIFLGFGWLKKWQAVTLGIFCALGIVFFLLTNFVGMQFYFPFMVPAVALAPSYWLGIMLITKKD